MYPPSEKYMDAFLWKQSAWCISLVVVYYSNNLKKIAARLVLFLHRQSELYPDSRKSYGLYPSTPIVYIQIHRFASILIVSKIFENCG